ncbi:MAG TPA: hypothetical protein VFN20_05585 [Candidatus Acidoferrum sp.]|nr:hypothetical protein [Candidatus Acidoferrum sp.]
MILGATIFILVLVLAAVGLAIGRRGLHRWFVPYVSQASKRHDPRPNEQVHLLLCIADHFEPGHSDASPQTAAARIDRWMTEYPKLFSAFRDSDGRSPQHTFFYPMEMYDPTHLDALAELRQRGHGDVEIHLHHDGETADELRRLLLEYKQILSTRHGLLSRRRETGEIVYGFIHGNWALNNSRPDGKHCGVNNELDVLRETGCYADFTFPSAPSPTQPRKINSIYYACGDPSRPRSHDRGTDVGSAPRPERSLMLIQGPLLLNWDSRKWGVAPRIENGCIQAGQPADERRVDRWLRARVQVPARPDWFFVKLHTHGATERNQPVLLGESMVRFHESLARRANRDRNFHYHYVTAREMYNLVRAAESRWTGTVEQARDFEVVPVNTNSSLHATAP